MSRFTSSALTKLNSFNTAGQRPGDAFDRQPADEVSNQSTGGGSDPYMFRNTSTGGGNTGGSGSSGGSGGGSSGGSGGSSSSSGGGDPYAGMPDWLRDLYRGQNGELPFGGDDYSGYGFFTGGEDLMRILLGEAGEMQGAADDHYNRILEREGQLEGFLDSMQGRYEDSRLSTMDPTEYASVQRAEQALADFQNRTAQDMSSASMAMQRQFATQHNDVMAGMRPDGSMMTPQEQQDASFRLEQTIGTARQQTMTTLMTNYNREAAAMGMQVAQMTNAAEQMNQQAEIVNATNQMRVMELELQGRQSLAQLTLNNPETVVSVLGGLMQLNQMGAGLHQMFGSLGGSDYGEYLAQLDQTDHNAYGSGQGTSYRWFEDNSFEAWMDENR